EIYRILRRHLRLPLRSISKETIRYIVKGGADEDRVLSWFSGLIEKLETFAQDVTSTPILRRRPLAQPNKPISGSTSERKMDVGFVSEADAGKDSKC
ncbi:hypothetical protein B0T24DRAFT_512697, partial [Lasiosphaeria ovina]